MQDVVVDQPYRFVPPIYLNLWPSLLRFYLPRYLRTAWGVTQVECRFTDRLRQSLDAGHGILLAANHCRLSDPLVLGLLARRAGTNVFAMASWHLFMQGRFSHFMIRRMGAFSVYREGLDKTAVATAIDILENARRPLILFPEGAVSRHNDQLMALMEGTSLIARTAAKRRLKRSVDAKVVVHPVAIRYFFKGDLETSLCPVLTRIETRLSWHSQQGKPLMERIRLVGKALLTLKEIEYFGSARQGDIYARVTDLINHLLEPLESEWAVAGRAANVIGRVKNLRTAILPDLVAGQISEQERVRRWQQLTDCGLAQQLSLYPQDYVGPDNNIPEHVLETVERFEENLTDVVTLHGPLHAVVQVGKPIEAPARRQRSAGGDPIMSGIESQLREMLAALAHESATPA